MREIVEGFFSSCMINLNFGENGKSNSSTALYFISTCGEFFTYGESFFHLHSSTTLYFIFIFIKIIFLLFYFNFFFSLLISLFFFVLYSGDPFHRPRPKTHSKPKSARPTANPDRQDPRQTQAHPKQTKAQIAVGTKTQTHEQTQVRRDQNPSPPSTQPPPENQQRRGESYGEQRERTEKRGRAQWRERRKM